MHQAANSALLKYAGNGKWSYEEDAYNPANMEKMMHGWLQAKERCAKEEDPVGKRYSEPGGL